MSKKLIPRLIVALAFLAAAVFYLLSELVPERFGAFNLAWAGVLFAGMSGIALLISAFGVKNSVTLKKLQIALSCALVLVAAVCLISALALPGNLILPIILVVIAFFLVVGTLVVGGRKWDEGDNHKAGYKNYYQRKAEEEEGKRIEKQNTEPHDDADLFDK